VEHNGDPQVKCADAPDYCLALTQRADDSLRAKRQHGHKQAFLFCSPGALTLANKPEKQDTTYFPGLSALTENLLLVFVFFVVLFVFVAFLHFVLFGVVVAAISRAFHLGTVTLSLFVFTVGAGGGLFDLVALSLFAFTVGAGGGLLGLVALFLFAFTVGAGLALLLGWLYVFLRDNGDCKSNRQQKNR
jgi:hypothetical protein